MNRAMDMELSDRRIQILRTLIDAYIESSEPIGSKSTVFEKFNLSSATLRNEMARLEEMGLLFQPHTSSGRVPSKLGYRFYVANLKDSLKLDAKRKKSIDQMIEMLAARPDKIFSNSAQIAASITNCAAISIYSIPGSRKFVYFECAMINSRSVAIMAVMGADNIKTCVYLTDEDINVNDSTVLNRILNVHLTGVEIKSLTDTVFGVIEQEILRYVPSMAGITKALQSIISEVNAYEIVVCGESNLLLYPEFSDVEKLKSFDSLVSDRKNLGRIADQPADGGIGVHIDPELFPSATLLTASIGNEESGKATLSVVGPMRINYARIIADFKYFSEIMSKLIQGMTEDEKE